jgi:hypothetical protein
MNLDTITVFNTNSQFVILPADAIDYGVAWRIPLEF